MSLTKEDLNSIKKIVSETEKSLNGKIEQSEERIIIKINKEIADLADINRAVINRTDELDYRLRIVERKLGIGSR